MGGSISNSIFYLYEVCMISWHIFLNRTPQNHLPELQGRQIFTDPPAMGARPPVKPARHSPEAKPMADGQGEAAWGISGQAYTDNIINFFKNLFNLCLPYEMHFLFLFHRGDTCPK
jgi:hypothetical protein